MREFGRCNICGENRSLFGNAVLMGRRSVNYYRCAVCGFVQTEDPDWLEEAYSDVIAETDIGYVARNIELAERAESVISNGFDKTGRFLDFGGGYGMLVRLLRDRGLDFYRDDPYCDNLFARGFDRTGADSGYELVTAFEVAEHLPNPIDGFGAMLRRSDSVLFSTRLLPDPPPAPGEWWYYAVETGQHLSLYTNSALAALANRFNIGFASSSSGDLHLLTNNRRALRRFRFAARRNVAHYSRLFRRRKSLIEKDYESLTGRSIS